MFNEETWQHLFTYAYLFFLTVLGGTASFALKVKKGLVRWCNFTELFGEYAISGIAGLAMHHLALASKVDPNLNAFFVSIAAVSGSKFIGIFEDYISNKLTKVLK